MNLSPIKATSKTKKPSSLPLPSGKRFLTRDFISDSLYNPEYGYFSKRAVIFSPPNDIQFNAIKDSNEFTAKISSLYKSYDEVEHDESLQIWHTPVELFKPWYGYSLAKYIVSEHKKKKSEYLNIYEMGAGNGTLMCNILNYIKTNEPEIYSKTRYNIIEISQQLSERQQWNNISRLDMEIKQFHSVQIINKSIFEWNKVVEDECFFIALEDNFAHDAIRYELKNPSNIYQTIVSCDNSNEVLEEELVPLNDELIQRYLLYRQKTGYPAFEPNWMDKLSTRIPFAYPYSDPEFLPTMQFRFLEILNKYFPRHRLILSDFDSLPTLVKGINAPVVQTRQKFNMIPCSTYLVAPGWFDIFFPTDFETMKAIYDLIQGSNHSSVVTHSEFLKEYAELSAVQTKSGEVPMFDHYSNVKFLLS